MNYPVPSAPLALSTDASQRHLGASLDQFVDGKWVPLGFWSKSLQPHQQRYSTFRRELLAIKFAVRNFINDINGRNCVVYTDHRPILGSWKNQDLQVHDSVAINALNEIGQWISDIRYRPGKELVVPDLLSRPPNSPGTAYQLDPDEVEYVSPDKTMAALEGVALNIINPQNLAEAQKSCPEVKAHKEGHHPRGVLMEEVEIADLHTPNLDTHSIKALQHSEAMAEAMG